MSPRRYQPGRVAAPASVLAPLCTYGDGPEATYLLECWSERTLYVGVAKATRLHARLREHWNDSWLDPRLFSRGSGMKFEANVAFMAVHGFKQTLAAVYHPDRAAAERLECDWTYELIEHARIVFGRGVTANCPGTKWLAGFGGVPWWSRNTVRAAR